MHEDTVALLGQCTAGIDLTVSAINGLLPNTKDHRLRKRLQDCVDDHRLLRSHACRLLEQYGGKEKQPHILRMGVTALKANARMAIGGDDTTVADLVANSCDLGVRTLSKSQNRYCLAHTDALLLTQELIRCEEGLSSQLRPYL